MSKYYVIFDTNVVVSGLMGIKKDSYPSRLLDYIYDGIIKPIYSKDILDEYKEVLSRKEFLFTKKQIGDFINSIKKLGIKIDPKKLDIDFVDTDDLVFYEVLMTKTNMQKYLTTGNIKHFPKNTLIKTPKEMVDIIRG